MGDSTEWKLRDSTAIELTGKIMIVAIIVIFFGVVFVLFLHLYAKWFWYRREDTVATRRRRGFDPGHVESAAASGLRRGLDPSVLKSLPVVMFNPKDFKDGLECAVCLSDLADGEKARLLPKCKHGFHVGCIDMWFQSHSTCPLCRNPVSTQSSATPELEIPRAENSAVSTDFPNFPTNVLFWGNQTRVSSLGSSLEEENRQAPTSSQPPCSWSSSSSSSTISRPDGMLVIDIPRLVAEDEEPKSPAITRIRSLKRLLSRDRRVSPCSPNVDSELASVEGH